MMRAALIAVVMLHAAAAFAQADGFYREDLRIPMAEADPNGLEALLVRPSGPQRYPLALISHGTPRDPTARPAMSPYRMLRPAIEDRPTRLCGTGRHAQGLRRLGRFVR